MCWVATKRRGRKSTSAPSGAPGASGLVAWVDADGRLNAATIALCRCRPSSAGSPERACSISARGDASWRVGRFLGPRSDHRHHRRSPTPQGAADPALGRSRFRCRLRTAAESGRATQWLQASARSSTAMAWTTSSASGRSPRPPAALEVLDPVRRPLRARHNKASLRRRPGRSARTPGKRGAIRPGGLDLKRAGLQARAAATSSLSFPGAVRQRRCSAPPDRGRRASSAISRHSWLRNLQTALVIAMHRDSTARRPCTRSSTR